MSNVVTVGQVIRGSKSDAILGIDDRDLILDYIRRAVELAEFKANWNVSTQVLDVSSDQFGFVTLPAFVGTVLQVNVGGYPTIFRNQWFSFHVNGPGDRCGPNCGFSTDAGWSPIFQDLTDWMLVTALCEDPTDGDGSKVMIVEGETMDAQNNIKEAITIPVSGPSSPGIQIPLLAGVANTDPAVTFFRKITRITKPVTRGYVKLIAFKMQQMALSVTLGYYAPNETNPLYRRIKVGQRCRWVRIVYRRDNTALVNDHDVVPIGSYEAMLLLLKSIRLSDSNNIDLSEQYLGRAVRLLNEIQSIQSGGTYSPIQTDPSWFLGTIDYR